MVSPHTLRKSSPRPRRTAACVLIFILLIAAGARSAGAQPAPESYSGTWLFDDQGGIIRDLPVVAKATFNVSAESISGTLTIGDGTDTVGKPLKDVLGSEIAVTGTRDNDTKTFVAFKYTGGKLNKEATKDLSLSSIQFDRDTATGYLLYEGGPFLGLQFKLKRGGPAPPPLVAAQPATLFDANPALIEAAISSLMEPLPFTSEVQLQNVLPKILDADTTLRRRGTAADGLSMLLIVQKYASAGRATFRLPDGQDMGGLLLPVGPRPDFSLWRHGHHPGSNTAGVKTVQLGSSHYAVALYMPPAMFNDDQSAGRKIFFQHRDTFTASLTAPPGASPETSIAARTVDVSIEFRSDTNSAHNSTAKQSIEIVRPPVVLVHGTFDAPYECWDTPWLGGKTMVQRLQEHGFQVWLVDYRNTNGKYDRGQSYFEDNSRVVAGTQPMLTRQRDAVVAGTDVSKFGATHTDTGGVVFALLSFRANGFAATQSDVVAHSLGGVLSRVCASSAYNPQYKSPSNFNQGLIRRLITISTTHFGSDCERPVVKYPPISMQLLNFRTSGEIRTYPLMSQRDRLAGEIVPLLVNYTSGTLTGAFEDQTPGSPALKKIGPTDVPAHAIACVCADRDLDGVVERGDFPASAFEGTPTDQQLADLRGFEDGYRRRLAAACFLTPDEIFEQTLPDLQKPDAARLIRLRTALSDDLSDYAGFWKTKNFQAFIALKDNVRPVEEALKEAIAEVTLIENGRPIFATGKNMQFFRDWAYPRYWELVRMYRAMIFGCCENDCTVRVESSLCGLREGDRGTTVLRGVLHGYAPAYASVKDRVVELLRGNLDQFRLEGFDAAGRDINEFNRLLDRSAEMTQVTVPDLVRRPITEALDLLSQSPYSDVRFRAAVVVPQRAAPDVLFDRSRISGTVTDQDQLKNTRVLSDAVIRLYYE